MGCEPRSGVLPPEPRRLPGASLSALLGLPPLQVCTGCPREPLSPPPRSRSWLGASAAIACSTSPAAMAASRQDLERAGVGAASVRTMLKMLSRCCESLRSGSASNPVKAQAPGQLQRRSFGLCHRRQSSSCAPGWLTATVRGSIREPACCCPGQGRLVEQHEELLAGHTPDRM